MKTLLYLGTVGLFLLLLGLVGALVGLNYYSRDLPDYSYLKDYRPPNLSRVYAGDGRLLSTIASERRIFVPVAVIPKRVINAFLSAEDQDFYKHHGVDFFGIIKASINNVQKLVNDRRPAGASTITQQVAKNFLLTNELSIARKVKEAILAVRIERTLSKSRILELYLNQIFLGNRAYGVASAALYYFGKSLNDLSIAEAAYLAALPKAPNNYHPKRNHDAAKARRDWVIGRMLEDGHITKDEAKQALATPLTMIEEEHQNIVRAEYYSEEVRRELIEKYGEKEVLEGGLLVRTSLDPLLQTYATKALRDGLQDFDRDRRGYRGAVAHFDTLESWSKKLAAVAFPAGADDWRLAVVLELEKDKAIIGFSDKAKSEIPWSEMRWARRELKNGRFGAAVNKPADVLKAGDVVLVEPVGDKTGAQYGLRQVPEVEGAIVAMDPHTGRVFAMTGGFSTHISQFNRATQAYRQPGSAFKPFIYLAALDAGLTPSSLVQDAPFVYNQGPGLPLWRPENYSNEFYGPTPLRVGIEKSRNVMTVRLANAVGMEKVTEYAKKFGIVDDMPKLLSYSLGAKETTLLRMTNAYAMLDNGGRKVTPTLIDRVDDRDGRIIWRRDNLQCVNCEIAGIAGKYMPPEIPDTRPEIANPRTVYQMVSILEGVVQRGTAQKLKSLNIPIAGKTGTTNNNKDAWFIGFSPDLVVGVFVGYDEPKPLGAKATGGSVAVPIFKKFMKMALKDKPAVPFRVPPGLVQVRVHPSTGQPAFGDGTIWEAYLPGTEPGSGAYHRIIDGSVANTLGNIDGYATTTVMQGDPQAGGVRTLPKQGGNVSGGVYRPSSYPYNQQAQPEQEQEEEYEQPAYQQQRYQPAQAAPTQAPMQAYERPQPAPQNQPISSGTGGLY